MMNNDNNFNNGQNQPIEGQQNHTPVEQPNPSQGQNPQSMNTGSWSNTGYTQTQQTYTAQPQGSNPQQTWGTWNGQGYSPYAASAAQPQKKAKKTGLGAGVVALLLCACLIVGAGAGVGSTLLVNRIVANHTEKQPMTPTNDTPSSILNGQGATATLQKGGAQVILQSSVGIGSAEGTVASIAQVVSSVKDAVVEITTETVVSGNYFKQYVTAGAGSGVIIAQEGYIITNNHVISGANNITVRTTNGSEYTATIIGADATTDIAVIKIEPTETLSVAVLGDSSQLVVGEDAIVIGNPLGSLGGTVTNGIISALDREVTIEGESMRLLQTNAAVNPGNSGGGMFNLAGELVGIVNAKSAGTDIEGLGFAIPVNTAQEVATQLIEYGYVRGRVDIGLSMLDVDNILDAMSYGLRSLGVYVYDSPYNDQIKSGDRIQSVNGIAVNSQADVKAAYRDCAVGDVITVSVVRGSRVIDVQVTLREAVPTNSGVQFGD